MALLIALLLGLSHPFNPRSRFSLGLCERLFWLALQVFLPGLSGIMINLQLFPAPLHSAAALIPRANASAIVTSFSVILGESKVPNVAKSQDLTKFWISENLATLSAVIKLSLGALGRTADGLRSSSHDRPAPASPAWVGADTAISSGRPSVRWRLWIGKLIAGFFPRITRVGAYSQNNLVRLLQPRDHKEKGRIRF
ncbi:LOW QUALITY PROTEIN: hypothetical protein Cgig2_025686 [Carnegiea gigantea]|uniref:Uncharacterized protein n=1 Tax=Carnegiea gigantea TaxID=171969 RepID=A0A9Q1JU29_9CARY|nr:LOW QUALITY PROTEIN: hypothetical protein Cgig2_025686 [Carnegiea gigantea]